VQIYDAKIQLSFHLTKNFRHKLPADSFFRSTQVVLFLFERFFILFEYLLSFFSSDFVLFCSENDFCS